MTTEIVQAGRFEKTRVYIHRRSRKEGRLVDGRYIRVGGVFRLGTPPLKPRQFMGIHSHLCMTVSYPDYIRGLLDVAADLSSHPVLGQFTWSNPVKSKVLNDDLWYFVPESVWGFKSGEFAETIKTHSTLSIIQGIGGGTYYLLNLPLITREYLRARYKTQRVFKRKPGSPKKSGQDKNPALKS